jgi:hypothetical protein
VVPSGHASLRALLTTPTLRRCTPSGVAPSGHASLRALVHTAQPVGCRPLWDAFPVQGQVGIIVFLRLTSAALLHLSGLAIDVSSGIANCILLQHSACQTADSCFLIFCLRSLYGHCARVMCPFGLWLLFMPLASNAPSLLDRVLRHITACTISCMRGFCLWQSDRTICCRSLMFHIFSGQCRDNVCCAVFGHNVLIPLPCPAALQYSFFPGWVP